ncbi:MAG: nuclease-related domain-containing protein [Sarcina sp.]
MLILSLIIIGLIVFIILNEAYLFLASKFIKKPTRENLSIFMTSCKYSVGRSRNNPDTWTKLRKVLHMAMLEIDIDDKVKMELKQMLIRKGLKDTKYLNKIIKANSEVLDVLDKKSTGALSNSTNSLYQNNKKKGTGTLNTTMKNKGSGTLDGERQGSKSVNLNGNTKRGTGHLNQRRNQNGRNTSRNLNKNARQTNTLNSGRTGEAKVNYTLKWLANVGVINNVRLKGSDEIQQFDNIVISNSGIYHLEVKNVGGENGCKITIQNSGDWIRKDNVTGMEKGMSNPEFQLYRHQKVLEQFLIDQGFSVKRLVKGIIVIANENTIIEGRENAKETIVKVDSLINYLESKCKKLLSDEEVVEIYNCINKNDIKNNIHAVN